MNELNTSHLLITYAKMTQSVRTQVASSAIARLEQKQLGSVSVVHAFVGYAEQPDKFLRIVIELFQDFFGSLVKDDRGILQLVQGNIN